MSLLTDDEVLNSAASTLGEMHVENCGLGEIKDFARAVEAAILARLASAELPEPALSRRKDREYFDQYEYREGNSDPMFWEQFYTTDQLRQAYAQGAASQLSAVPSGFLSQHNLEMLKQGYPQTIVMLEGAKRDVPLFTLKEPTP